MADPVLIVGGYLSPYVRKVLVFLHLKRIPYTIDPIIPFMGDDRFTRLSPLRRIPVLVDGDLTLTDSSVICQYLEDRHPEPALYPREVAARARARWLEEFADTRMGEVFIWRLFNQVAINPFVWGQKTNDEILSRTLATEIPHVLDYLESERRLRPLQRGRGALAADGRPGRAHARQRGLPTAPAVRGSPDPDAGSAAPRRPDGDGRAARRRELRHPHAAARRDVSATQDVLGRAARSRRRSRSGTPGVASTKPPRAYDRGPGERRARGTSCRG